jgi:hypothetical protein
MTEIRPDVSPSPLAAGDATASALTVPPAAWERALRELAEPGKLPAVGRLVFPGFEDGNGLVLARAATPEPYRLLEQLNRVRSALEREGLRPALIVAGVEPSRPVLVSSSLLTAVLRQVRMFRLLWVAVSEPSRVSRSLPTFEQFDSAVQAMGARLLVDGQPAQEVGQAMRDRISRLVEGAAINRRTRAALQRTWLEEGRGWPGPPPFGLQRDGDRRLVPDPAGMAVVRRAHELFGENASRAATRRALAAEGHDLSAAELNRVLKDRLYSDGSWSVTVAGERLAQLPLDLGTHAVPAGVFERTQRTLLRLRRPDETGGSSEAPA